VALEQRLLGSAEAAVGEANRTRRLAGRSAAATVGQIERPP
jgi:hypothetical protein